MQEFDVPPGVDITKPSAARMYDYYLGGTYNFEVDRETAKKVMQTTPAAEFAMANRAFLRRAVQFLVNQGITQFLDLGSGIPTVGNVHEVAQKLNPDCRVVYVDNEPVAVAHAESLLSENPLAIPIQNDLRNPQAILEHPEVRSLLDFDQPIGLLMMAVLHFIPDSDRPKELVATYRDALAPGSYVVLSHATTDAAKHRIQDAADMYQNAQNQAFLRSYDDIVALFEGLDVVEPGIVYTPLWRPEHSADVPQDVSRSLAYGGVGYKK